MLEGAPFSDSIMVLGDFNAHVVNGTEAGWGVIGRDGLPELNLSGVLLLDFSTNHNSSITNTVFKHKQSP